jgi:hypothetical protein
VLTTYPLLAPRSGKSRAIPLTPFGPSGLLRGTFTFTFYIPEYSNGENQTYIVYIRCTQKTNTITLWLALSHSERNAAVVLLLPCLSTLPPVCSLNVHSQKFILQSFTKVFHALQFCIRISPKIMDTLKYVLHALCEHNAR